MARPCSSCRTFGSQIFEIDHSSGYPKEFSPNLSLVEVEIPTSSHRTPGLETWIGPKKLPLIYVPLVEDRENWESWSHVSIQANT